MKLELKSNNTCGESICSICEKEFQLQPIVFVTCDTKKDVCLVCAAKNHPELIPEFHNEATENHLEMAKKFTSFEEVGEQKKPVEKKDKKTELMVHYLRKKPTDFIQYDAFINVEPGDSYITPDAEGDCVFGDMKTTELMSGVPVRVLITPDTSKSDVLRALMKIADMIYNSEIIDTIYSENELPF